MFSERAFFSFVELSDPARHREYNEWHQLDHRPENLLLPGVAWGDRWARTAECVAQGDEPAPEYAGVDYVAMYWFRPPYTESISAWSKLGEDSFQWGRGPLIPGVRRPLLAFFTPVMGYAAPRVRVSADALPFRPNRGLHISLTRVAEPHGSKTHEQFRWHDEVRIPDLLTCAGVAGAWTFSLFEPQRHPTLPIGDIDADPGSLRVRLLYLDDDPVTTSQRIAMHTREWDAAGRGAPYPEAEQTLLAGPVSSISPWQDLPAPR